MLDLNKVGSIRGWFHSYEAEWLYNLCLGRSRVLEIGAWQGRSTFTLLSALRDTPPDKQIPKVVVSIDPYTIKQGQPYSELETENGRVSIIRSLKENISEFETTNVPDNLSRVCHVLLKIKTPEAFSLLNTHSFDLAFIDGDHSHPAVREDIRGCHRLVRPGGIICGHDYGQVSEVVGELLPSATNPVGSCWQYLVPA